MQDRSGAGTGIVRLDLFPGEEDVNRLTSLAGGAVHEDMDAERESMDETDGLEGTRCPFEIGASDEDVDVDRCSHGRRVDPRHPRRHGMSAGNRMGNAGRIERGNRPLQPFLDHRHRLLNTVEHVEAEPDDARPRHRHHVVAWTR